jgi:hypothetical protein
LALLARQKAGLAPWVEPFLTALADCGCVGRAARAAGVTRQCVYQLRKRHPDFAAAWDEAVQAGQESLEVEAIRRGRDGVEKPVLYKGQQVNIWVDTEGKPTSMSTPGARLSPLVVREYSDTLLIFMLKALDPDKYRESKETRHKRVPQEQQRPAIDFSQLPPEDLAALERIYERLAGDAGAGGEASTGQIAQLTEGEGQPS